MDNTASFPTCLKLIKKCPVPSVSMHNLYISIFHKTLAFNEGINLFSERKDESQITLSFNIYSFI